MDLLRGVVMALMALDHVRDFFTGGHVNPLDLSQTTAALFLTRWVTHLCAPVFIFLAGAGTFLARTRGKTRRQLATILLTRGLWLVALEFTLVHFGWCFFDYRFLLGQVIWATGWGMVALAGLIFLPAWSVATLGLALVAGLNLFDGVTPAQLGRFGWLWKILGCGGFLEWRGIQFYAAYPLLPWLGVLLLGYGSGPVWLLDRPARRRRLLALGTAGVLLFVAIRTVNRYGDPHPWAPQPTALFSALSFLNCEKYPPSLLYLLMTLGPTLVMLAWWDRTPGFWGHVFVTLGRVPLFFYLLHVPLIHLLAVAFAFARFGRADFLFQSIFLARDRGMPADYGYDLPTVYAVWLGVMVLLYPACRWFARLKGQRRSAWLSYL